MANTQVKSKADLAKPEVKEFIRNHAIKAIKDSAQQTNPLFAEQVAQEQIKQVDAILDIAVAKFIENIIEIPRMTVQKEVFRAEYCWFDLDTTIGFDLPALADEIIRVSIGAGEKSVDTLKVELGRKFDKPLDQIVNTLIDYDDIDYDENSDLLYHLAGQAIEAISSHLEDSDDLPKVVHEFKKAIASTIYDQMKRHFRMISTGYVKPKVLPFSWLITPFAFLL